MSRFDLSIKFPLPNEKERGLIFASYAQHLSSEDITYLAGDYYYIIYNINIIYIIYNINIILIHFFFFFFSKQ